MDFDEDEQVYTYPCPCGDKFMITVVSLFFCVITERSFQCMLTICFLRTIYETVKM